MVRSRLRRLHFFCRWLWCFWKPTWGACLGDWLVRLKCVRNIHAIFLDLEAHAIWFRFNTRFRTRFQRVTVQTAGEVSKVPVQIAPEVPVKGSCEDTCGGSTVLEGSRGADTWWGSRGFWCIYPEVSGADTWWGSGGFRWRRPVKIRGESAVIGRVPVELQIRLCPFLLAVSVNGPSCGVRRIWFTIVHWLPLITCKSLGRNAIANRPTLA